MVGVILAGSEGRADSFMNGLGEYRGAVNGRRGDLKSCVARAPKSVLPGCDSVSNMVQSSPGCGFGDGADARPLPSSKCIYNRVDVLLGVAD